MVFTFSSLSKSLSFPEIATSVINSVLSFLKSANVMLDFLYLYKCWIIQNLYPIILKCFLMLFLHTSLPHSSLYFFSTPGADFQVPDNVLCQGACVDWALNYNMLLYFWFLQRTNGLVEYEKGERWQSLIKGRTHCSKLLPVPWLPHILNDNLKFFG